MIAAGASHIARCAGIALFLATISGVRDAAASEIIFQDGKSMKGVRIIARSKTFVSVETDTGIIRFPIAAVKFIDGQPTVVALTTTPEEPAVAAPGEPPSISTDQGAQVPPPAAEAQVPAEETPAGPAAPDRWNFEFALLALLAAGAVWMRSVQAVERHLANRLIPPGPWPLAALVLPGVGAIACFAWTGITGRLPGIGKQKAPVNDTTADPDPAWQSGTGLKFPWQGHLPIDPAEHKAQKEAIEAANEAPASSQEFAGLATSEIPDLAALGMSDDMRATLLGIVQSRRSGMILATGPAGSGKTTTLYAALSQLDPERLAIMVIDDGASYELPGSTRIILNPAEGITYENALRSILGQDPDVILVGEMEDADTADVAMRASSRGHLVFSSLPAANAIAAIARLREMRIDFHQAAPALRAIVGQRLVRALCPQCREAYAARGDEIESLGFTFEPGSAIYRAVGCGACEGTGFLGHTGLFELLVLDEELQGLIAGGADAGALMAAAIERGFKNYHQDGAEKILLGATTVEEVQQTT